MRFTSYIAASALAAFANAQTFTECNPMEKTCPNDPAMAATFDTDFKAGAANVKGWRQTAGSLTYNAEGAQFTINKQGESPTIQSETYLHFGYVEVRCKAAAGQGIISSIVIQSEDLDEIDWEFLGGVSNSVQMNYFGKGNTTTYDRMLEAPVSNVQEMHTYALDWTAERIVFIIDGTPVRTLNYADANGGKNFPQTPSTVRIGIWAGGDPNNGPGVIEWAGGRTDYTKAPFTMTVESVKVKNYSPGTEYKWTDKSGSWQSIEVIGKDNVEGAPENDKPIETSAPVVATDGGLASEIDIPKSTDIVSTLTASLPTGTAGFSFPTASAIPTASATGGYGQPIGTGIGGSSQIASSQAPYPTTGPGVNGTLPQISTSCTDESSVALPTISTSCTDESSAALPTISTSCTDESSAALPTISTSCTDSTAIATGTPAETPVYVPGETPVETPVEGPTDYPVGGPTAPVEGPESTPVAGPEETPVNGPGEYPTNGSGEYPVNGPESTPVAGPESTPVSGPEETPVNGPGEYPTNGPEPTPVAGPEETPVYGPGETPVETPVAGPEETPVNGPGEYPAESTPVAGPEETPVNGPGEYPAASTPVAGPEETPVYGPGETPVETPVEGPEDTPVETPIGGETPTTLVSSYALPAETSPSSDYNVPPAVGASQNPSAAPYPTGGVYTDNQPAPSGTVPTGGYAAPSDASPSASGTSGFGTSTPLPSQFAGSASTNKAGAFAVLVAAAALLVV